MTSNSSCFSSSHISYGTENPRLVIVSRVHMVIQRILVPWNSSHNSRIRWGNYESALVSLSGHWTVVSILVHDTAVRQAMES